MIVTGRDDHVATPNVLLDETLAESKLTESDILTDDQPSTAEAPASLPKGWTAVPHAGDTYYWNQHTGETQWARPTSDQCAGRGTVQLPKRVGTEDSRPR